MFENVKDKVQEHKAAAYVGAGSLVTGGAFAAAPALALAEGETASISTVTSSMTTAFTGFASDALSAIGSIVPVVLPIMGALVVVGIGVKVFKRFAK